jgi:hypothetical protein
MTEEWELAVDLLRTNWCSDDYGPQNCITRLANAWKMRHGISKYSADEFLATYGDMSRNQLVEVDRRQYFKEYYKP